MEYTAQCEHVTARTGFAIADGADAVTYRNSLLVNLPDCWATTCNIPTDTHWSTTDEPALFQSAGAGNYYLANGSIHRGSGTATINNDLKTALARMTTYPPEILTGTAAPNLILGPRPMWGHLHQIKLSYGRGLVRSKMVPYLISLVPFWIQFIKELCTSRSDFIRNARWIEQGRNDMAVPVVSISVGVEPNCAINELGVYNQLSRSCGRPLARHKLTCDKSSLLPFAQNLTRGPLIGPHFRHLSFHED